MPENPDLTARLVEAAKLVAERGLWPDLRGAHDVLPPESKIEVSAWTERAAQESEADPNAVLGQAERIFLSLLTIWVPGDGPFMAVARILDWELQEWSDRIEGIVKLIRIRQQQALLDAKNGYLLHLKRFGDDVSPERDKERINRTGNRLSMEKQPCLLCRRPTGNVLLMVLPTRKETGIVVPGRPELTRKSYEAKRVAFYRVCAQCQRIAGWTKRVEFLLGKRISEKALTYGTAV